MARGSIDKRKTAAGETRYRARIAIGVNPATGQRIMEAQTFRTRKAAERWLNQKADEIDAGSYQRPSMELLANYLDHWLNTHNMAPSSRSAYERVVRKWIVPAIGNVPLSQLTGRHVQDLFNEARGTSSIGQIQAVMVGALRLAVREGLIARNVAEGLTVVGPARDEEREAPVWTAPQLRTFLEGVSSHWLYPLFWTAAYTGLRIGELVSLRWDDITLDMAMLFVKRDHKSAAGRRRVALDPDTVTVLRRHAAEQERRREVLGPDWQDHGLVFDRGDGRPVAPRTVEHVMARTVRQLELTPALTPHGLRHTHASLLAAAGRPLQYIQQRLGHASYSTTARYYLHFLPDAERDDAALFAALMRDSEGVCVQEVSTEESAS